MAIQLAGCIILDSSNRILLLHRNKKETTQWELPGGKVEQHEDKSTAAKRELLEELGVIVDIDKHIDKTSFSSGSNDYTYTWFLATIRSGKPHICEPETFDDIGYFNLDDFKSIELSGNMQEFAKYLKRNNLNLKDLAQEK